MPFSAQVVKVMIAGPSDVGDSTREIEAAIHKWNGHNAESRKVILLPKHWLTSVAPEQGNRPQGIVNDQMGMSDVLVAVFHARLGSPTGVAVSGTVEEIDRHKAAGKVVMIYTLRLQGRSGSVDPIQLRMLQDAVAIWRNDGIVREDVEHGQLADQVFDHLTRHADRKGWGRPDREATPASRRGTSVDLHTDAKCLLLAAAESSDFRVFVNINGQEVRVQVSGLGTRYQAFDRIRALEMERAVQTLVRARYLSGKDGHYQITADGLDKAKLYKSQGEQGWPRYDPPKPAPPQPASRPQESRFVSRRPSDGE